MADDDLIAALRGGRGLDPLPAPPAQANSDLQWLLGRMNYSGAREAAANLAAQRGNVGTPMDWALAMGGGPGKAPPMGMTKTGPWYVPNPQPPTPKPWGGQFGQPPMPKELIAQQAAAEAKQQTPTEFLQALFPKYDWGKYTPTQLELVAKNSGWVPQGETPKSSTGVSLSPGFKTFEKNYNKSESIADKAEASLWDTADEASDKYKSIADNFKKELNYKNLPIDETVRQLNAQKMGFTTPSFRGVSQEPRRSPDSNWGDSLQYYSTTNPKLAEMYARQMRTGDDKHPQIQPLLLNTEKYHVVDAGGDRWENVNRKAIRAAQGNGSTGVVIHNVVDEPHSTNKLGPQTIYITLDPSTARSKFARFDPAKMGLNDLLASGAGVAVATGAAHKILQNPDGTLQAAQE